MTVLAERTPLFLPQLDIFAAQGLTYIVESLVGFGRPGGR